MTLVVGVLVLSGMLLISGLAWPLVLLILFAAFAISFVGAHLIFGHRAVLHFGHTLKWKKCKRCTGGGQWLNTNGSGWGPIPEEIRIVQDGNVYFEAPQGNIRSCPHCQLGGHWEESS